jgi:hypothetical protein
MGPMLELRAVMPSVTCALGDDHEGAGIVVEAAVADVADDADDLPGGLSELGADAFADEELLANGILFGEVFFREWSR